MNFKELATKRYSTKKYDRTKSVSERDLQTLKEILVLCPSSVNSQPWKFTFISNNSLKNKLSKVSQHNESKIQEASHLIVFSAIDNLQLLEEQVEKIMPVERVALFKKHVGSLTEEATKVWIEKQVYIALGFFLSACASMDIDATPMEGIEVDKYKEILNLKNYKPQFAVCIGYHDKEDLNHPSVTAKSRLPLNEVIEDIL